MCGWAVRSLEFVCPFEERYPKNGTRISLRHVYAHLSQLGAAFLSGTTCQVHLSLQGKSTKRTKRRAQFFGEQLGLLPRGEMSALAGLVKVDQVRVGAANPGFWWAVDVFGKHRHGNGKCNIRGFLGGRHDGAVALVLPVKASCRRGGVREPV